MKKIISLNLVAALLMALVPLLSHATSGQITYTATYDGNVTLGTCTLGGITYTTVAYEGLENAGVSGKPSLPVDFISFSVPYNATNFTVTATPILSETLSLDYPVCPIQAGTSGITQPDILTYSLVVYPSAVAHHENEGIMAGENHIITVAVYPVSYIIGNSLKVWSSVDLTIDYDITPTPVIKPLIRRDTTLLKEGFELVRELVANPGDVRSNAASQSSNSQLICYNPPGLIDTVTDPSTYLIVTTPEMLRPMRRLSAIKRQKGIPVKVVTLNEVLNDPLSGNGDDYNGDGYAEYTDDAGKLRQYIRSHYINRGTKYVLLAGTDIPSRNNSDLSFSSLNPDYYSYVDKWHELDVGRLFGSSSEQCYNYTDKLLKYELNPGNGDYSYLKRAVYTEGPDYETFFGSTGTIWSEDTLITYDENLEFSASGLLNLINTNHYGFMSTFNEGTPTFIELYRDSSGQINHYLWAIDTVKVPNTIIDLDTDNGLNCMHNKNYPMVYYAPIGQTMPYESVEGYDADVNYAESFTMGKDYGGPVYIGYTEENIFSLLPYSASNVFSIFLSKLSEAKYVMSCALSKAKEWFSGMYNDELAQYTNFLGDPSLEIWSDIPQQYSNITVSRTDNTVTVSGIPVNSTTLAYHNNDGSTGKCEVISSTVTLSDVSPNSTIMLYKHNYIPYIAPLVLQNTDLENSQYVIASDVLAGKAVDNGRSQGEVTIVNGVEYEIEATGKVILNAGFNVERGAHFAVNRSMFND